MGYRRSSNSGGWYTSEDLRTWPWSDQVKKARFFAGCPSVDGKSVILPGSRNYNKGKHHADAAAFYRLDKGGLALEGEFPGYQYASCALATPAGEFIGLTRGWRSKRPGAKVVDTQGRTVAEFPEAEARGLAYADGSLIVATRTDTIRGVLYQVPLKKDDPRPAPGGDKMGSFRGYEKDKETVYRWGEPGEHYPNNLKICWYQGRNRRLVKTTIKDTAKEGHHDGVHWRPRSRARGTQWEGKLVVLLPLSSVAAYKKMGLKKGDKKGCWLDY